MAPEAAPELAMAIVEPPKPKSREDVLREAMVAIGRDPDAEETDRDDDDASSAEMTVDEPPPRVSPRAPPPADVLAAYHRALSDDSASEGFAASTQSARPPSPLSPLSPSLPSPPPLTPPPPLPPVPDAPPPPAPDAPPPPAPKYYRPPAMFDPLVSLPGVESDVAPLMDDGDVASLGRTDHLAVVSAYWEVHDERWRSKTRSKPAEYYRRGLHNLVRVAGRSGKSAVVYTAEGSNDCAGLEATYRQGYKQADTEDRPVEKEQRPRFICAKLPLRKLHYDDWHLADHSLVQNMPCAEKMRDTKLIWLNKINLVESAAHMLTLKGGARATLMEWVDADQLSELNDDAGVKKLEDVGMRWRDVPDHAGRLGDVAADQIPTETNAQRTAAAKPAAVASTNAARGSGKPPPGFKIIEGLEYGALAKEQLPEDELDGWQARAADRVAAMSAIHPALGGEGASSTLGETHAAAATLPLADRVQIGCYAPKQRVGPCTSNYFVASRFRATLYGVAAMRQAFEDVIFDFRRGVPSAGVRGLERAEPDVGGTLRRVVRSPGVSPVRSDVRQGRVRARRDVLELHLLHGGDDLQQDVPAKQKPLQPRQKLRHDEAVREVIQGRFRRRGPERAAETRDGAARISRAGGQKQTEERQKQTPARRRTTRRREGEVTQTPSAT